MHCEQTLLMLRAGDSLKWQVGYKFSTMDKDTPGKCAFNLVGAWWFHTKACAHSHLSGLYLFGPTNEGWRCLLWFHWKSHSYSLKFAQMKIRPYHIWTSRHLVFASVTEMRTLTWCNWNNKTIMIAACKELLLICLLTTNIRWFTVHLRCRYYTTNNQLNHVRIHERHATWQLCSYHKLALLHESAVMATTQVNGKPNIWPPPATHKPINR